VLIHSIARAPLEVDEFALRPTAASPAAVEARTHQRGNALLAEERGNALLAERVRRLGA
jgi:hypothetical protein